MNIIPSDTWTASWTCQKLIKHKKILVAKPIKENLISMNVSGYEPIVIVGTMSEQKVFLSNIPLVCKNSSIAFLLNIPQNAYFDGSVLSCSESAPFGIGGLGDLYRAINDKNFHKYLSPEIFFISRGLRQHNAVSSFSRKNNRLYLVNRPKKSTLKVLALNEYDLTADAIRTGIDTYGNCDIILASNPNCRLSKDACEIVGLEDIRVLKWGELLRAIPNA